MTYSQASSLPSPVIVHKVAVGMGVAVGIGDIDRVIECEESPKSVESLGNSDKKSGEATAVLNSIIPHLHNLDGVLEENVTMLIRLIGSHLNSEIKAEANYYRSKQSRDFDNNLMSSLPEEIIEKEYSNNNLHVFFESSTKKSGRLPGPQRRKVALLQANYYESILKGCNLNAVGPVNLLKSREAYQKVQSKQVLKMNIGGSYTFHQTDDSWCSQALPDTGKGPIISDNAQRGCGKFQRHAFGKLDRPTPVYVCTHNIRAESTRDDDDNDVFLYIRQK